MSDSAEPGSLPGDPSPGDPVAMFDQLYMREQTAQDEKKRAALIAWLLRIRQRIDEALQELWQYGHKHHHHHHHKQPFLLLLQPIFTNTETGAVMADIQLPLNQSYTAVITLFNPATQSADPVAATDVFTATPSDAVNMSATVAPFAPPGNATPAQTALAGIPALTVQWLFTTTPPLTDVTVTLTDSAGNTADTLAFDMVAATTVPDQIGTDATDAVFTTIAAPPAGA
jgi:hypothetical protein